MAHGTRLVIQGKFQLSWLWLKKGLYEIAWGIKDYFVGRFEKHKNQAGSLSDDYIEPEGIGGLGELVT